MATAQKHDLTQATGITAEVVLEQGKFYDAKDFRKVQTGLSSAARELRALTQYGNSIHGRLGARLSQEQRELLSNAAALLDSVKYNVEHAKERKAREEKAAAKLREQHERQAKQLVAQHFQLPTTTVEQQIEVLKLYIAIRPITDGWLLKQDGHLRDMMLSPAPSWTTTNKWRLDQVISLIADLKGHSGQHYPGPDRSWVPAQEGQGSAGIRRRRLADRRGAAGSGRSGHYRHLGAGPGHDRGRHHAVG